MKTLGLRQGLTIPWQGWGASLIPAFQLKKGPALLGQLLPHIGQAQIVAPDLGGGRLGGVILALQGMPLIFGHFVHQKCPLALSRMETRAVRRTADRIVAAW